MADTSLLFNVLAKDKATSVLSKVGGAAKAMGIAAAAGIGLLAKQSVDAARDLNETQSKVGVLFGKSAADVTRFADTAAVKMGQSKQAVLDGASTFAVYGKGAGMADKSLVKFSTGLTSLASDMASFSNTSPEEAIQAIGAAMRGESDPIEKYGVLLNETVLKARALKMGLIETTTQALTPQQRVLAVQAELMNQTKDAQGDFARTSGGLANQQRILTAQWANMKSTIGQALLPVVLSFTTVLTSQVMPALMALWQQHGPGVVAFLKDASTHFSQWAGQLQGMNWQALLGDAKALLSDLGPAMQGVKDSGPAFVDTLKVGGEVVGFLAQHSDLLAKALPYLAAGFLLVKTAQVASNVAAAVSVPLRIAELMANRRLAASNVQLTAAVAAQTTASRSAAAATAVSTVATTAGDVANKRSVISTIAAKTATIASSVATKAAAAAQWIFNAAMAANPIGLVVIAIAALVAGLIWAYNNVDWFRNAVNKALSFIVGVWRSSTAWIMAAVRGWWAMLQAAWNAIGSFLLGGVRKWLSGTQAVFRGIGAAAGWLKDQVVSRVSAIVSLMLSMPGRIQRVFAGAAGWLAAAGRNIITGLIRGITDKIGALRDKLSVVTNLIPDWKGPADKDARLLFPAGRLIVDGLMRGIAARLPDLRAQLGSVTSMVAGSLSAQQISNLPDAQRFAYQDRFGLPSAPAGYAWAEDASLVATSFYSRPAGAVHAGGGGGAPARVVVEFRGDDQLLRWLRHTVRVVGNGNVQVAFGRSS